MPKAFDPQAVEAGWYARWEADGLFTADPSSDRRKFAMCFPPPNITGELHMGHALQTAIYDLLARYRRMTGYEVLFLPGYDHAAIATQNVIEKQLAREGTTKEELGRGAFDARVDAWYSGKAEWYDLLALKDEEAVDALAERALSAKMRDNLKGRRQNRLDRAGIEIFKQWRHVLTLVMSGQLEV